MTIKEEKRNQSMDMSKWTAAGQFNITFKKLKKDLIYCTDITEALLKH